MCCLIALEIYDSPKQRVDRDALRALLVKLWGEPSKSHEWKMVWEPSDDSHRVGRVIEFKPGLVEVLVDMAGNGHDVLPESYVYAVKYAVSLYEAVQREPDTFGRKLELWQDRIPCDGKLIAANGSSPDLSKLCRAAIHHL